MSLRTQDGLICTLLFAASLGGCTASYEAGSLETAIDDERADRPCSFGATTCDANRYDAVQWPALGYVVAGTARTYLVAENCGATLVAPNVALTAAHCVTTADGSPRTGAFGFGVGETGSHHYLRAVRVVTHPRYTGNLTENIPYDVAVLELSAPFVGVAPVPVSNATVSPGAASCGELGYFSVGYGRSTPGGQDAPVIVGFRKRTELCTGGAPYLGADFLGTTSQGDGFVCWGDSGSGLVGPDGTLRGVFAHFDPRDFASPELCRPGNRGAFASVGHIWDWLAPELAVAEEHLKQYRVFSAEPSARVAAGKTVRAVLEINNGDRVASATVQVDVDYGSATALSTRLVRIRGGRVVEQIIPFEFGVYPQFADVPRMSNRSLEGTWHVEVVNSGEGEATFKSAALIVRYED